MPSRRHFLSLSGLALPGLLLPRLRWPVETVPQRDPALGLFFDAGVLPALRDRFAGEPLFAALRERLASFDRAAERRFMASEVRYNDHLFHFKRLYDTAQPMAFYYAMTDDEDAADLATAAIRAIMKFPTWDYFLEGGTEIVGIQRAAGATMAVAVCADWLGGFVDDRERAAWLRAMGERGCEPCFRSIYGMRHPDRVKGWTMDPASTYFEHRPGDRVDLSNWPAILDRTNLKAVPASALAVGATAYRLQFGPDADTERWLEQAVFSISSFRDLYARDGSYDEGISYANYTALHLAQATTILERFHDAAVYDLINWPGFVDYAYGMAMPTDSDPYAVVNFGDAGDGMMSAVPFWVARQSRDGRAQWFAQHLARAHDEWSLVWFTPASVAEPPPYRPHFWRSDLDWIVARTGYEAGDLVVAMRSGGPANHEHADRNSLIVKCFGEQLVADPYRPPYSFSDPAWMMRTTAGHSALLIDGRGHQYHDGSEGTNPSDAVARIVRAGERSGLFFWASDATPAYRLVLPDVRSVTRTVIVLHELPALVVLDKVLKTARPSRLQARFFAYNLDGEGRVEAAEKTFRILRPHASLLGVASAVQGIEAHTGRLPIPEERARRHPFIEVSTHEADLESMLITVLLPERGTGGQASALIQAHPGGVHDVDIRHGDRTARCRVFDTGSLPEFEVATL